MGRSSFEDTHPNVARCGEAEPLDVEFHHVERTASAMGKSGMPSAFVGILRTGTS
jgi:hypothetical protein